MINTAPKNPFYVIAADIISSPHGGFPLVEEACDLVVADGRFNWWMASQKQTSEASPLSEADWLQLLDDYELIRADTLQAWTEFRSYGWPRGRFDEWARVSDRLCNSLREARRRVDDLGRAHGRRNQRVQLSADPDM